MVVVVAAAAVVVLSAWWSVVMFVVVVAAGGWGWKVARGDSGFDGFVHVNESHVVGVCGVGTNAPSAGEHRCVI